MAIPQIKNSIQPLDVIATVNDVVDNKGVDQTYNASSTNAQAGVAVAEAISTKQDSLVSGTNIKTVNNNSLLGEGNIEISFPVDQTYSASSTNAQSGMAVAGAISNLVPDSRKVNGKALSGDITLTASDVSALPANTTIPVVSQTYSASSTDAQSGTAVASAISNKQDTLVSGTNIKTINNVSILGEGNIEISGGGDVDQTYDASSTNAQSGTAVAGAFEAMIDETFDGSSTNAQSGTAVAQALETIDVPNVTDDVTAESSDALSSGGAYTNLVRRLSGSSATGSTTQGIYVDANGQVQAGLAVTSTYSAIGTAPVNGTAVASALSPITTVIPSAASSTNQLADKAFVNSSISTNTATFRGTFESVEDLEAYSGPKTNNDYAFVETTDTAGNTYYDRYKYNGTSWEFEYEINNTSFTATQWSAINSGVTETIVNLASSALQPNTPITGGTHTKITYDSNGFVTGGSDLTMADITTALGYTPYDASNPANYTDNTGTVTSVNNIAPVNGNVTISIPAAQTVDQTYNASSTNAQSGTAIAGAGFLTSISSGDVTTALGYTPYSSTNPNNYITSSAVGNASIVFMQGSTNKGTITANQTIDTTISLDAAGTSITVDTVMSSTSTNPVQNKVITEALGNYVPTTRKVNDKALSGDITLTASDVSALPSDTSIEDLVTTAQQNALDSGVTSSIVTQVGTNTSSIAGIATLIPSAATISNQLADKAFVNSSIASNTANFIGTFNSVAELEAYSGTLTNNDYAFVETTDTAGNTLYDRYKYNGTEWLFEYELNNSSFTAVQWAAINSGVDETIVSLASSAMQPNTPITGSTHTKITYDSRGLVTAGADLTITDITTALGYTPYNSTNPDGYITSSAVGNASIVFTQGGIAKGTITANQTTNTTIALDAGGTSTVDNSLSTTSTNPVQNKVITSALNNKAAVTFVDWSS